jgi:Domain of unknown function (DUF4276)
VKELHIHCEGGGKGFGVTEPLRNGMRAFLKPLYDLASQKKVRITLTFHRGRDQAYKQFLSAMNDFPDIFHVLLVDTEAPVTNQEALQNPWVHLCEKDGWCLHQDKPDRCYLMVQAMEAWFMADKDALKEFYKQGFNVNALPANPRIEEIPKDQLEPSLKRASKTTTKGEYHKIKHGGKLLEVIRSTEVRKASPHCNRLFTTLENKINAAG